VVETALTDEGTLAETAATDVWARRLRALQYCLVGLTGAAAAVSLAGWAVGVLVLASVSPDWVPMAPVTAVAFFALCAALLVRIGTRRPRAHAWIVGIAAGGALLAALELADYVLGLPVSPDRLLVPQAGVVHGVATGRMSPVTAVALGALFAALAILENPSRRAQRAGVVTSIAVTAGAGILLIGYMYDAPLLYGAQLIPVALPSAAGLALLGVALAALGGADRWPLGLFMGESVRSQLMRGVFPVVAVTIVAVATLDEIAHRVGVDQSPVAISILFMCALTAVTLMVLNSATKIGARIEAAEAERGAAEKERDRYRQHLEGLVEERTRDLAAANRESQALNEQLSATNEQLSATNEELAALNEELLRATEAKSQFLANMSHELRTPLNSIIGYAGVLAQGLAGEINDEQRTQLAMVRRSGERLLALINDILDLSRIEAGGSEATPAAFKLSDVVNAAAETIRPLVDAAGLAFVLDDACEDVSLCTDEQKIHQVLVNLLGNAVKFTDAGSIALRVRVPDPDTVRFEVEDTGVGIAPDDLAAVFGEFVQVAHDGGKPEGTGLGLAISRRITLLLGGTLTATSDPGEGSVFVLTLPRSLPAGRTPEAASGPNP
jgi:signal transduction histidine kinase